MSFKSLLIKNVKISRQAVIGTNYVLSTVTGACCQYMPLSLQEASLYDGVFGKTFKIWFDAGEDVDEGDYIRDVDSGDLFVVKGSGVTTRSLGSIEYKCAIAERVG